MRSLVGWGGGKFKGENYVISIERFFFIAHRKKTVRKKRGWARTEEKKHDRRKRKINFSSFSSSSLSPLRYRNFQLTLDDTETSFARLLSLFSSFSLPKSRTLPQTSLLSLLSNPMDYRIHIGRREDNAGWKQDVYETFIDWSCRAGYCRQRWVSPSIAINIIHTHAIRLREKSGGEKTLKPIM